MQINKHLELLGLPVSDKVTRVEGVVTSVCFDLYGCIQAVVTPCLDSSGKRGESGWYDINRLTVLDSTPVMARPDFVAPNIPEGGKGSAEKPAFSAP